jgi:hypothetical protein
MRNTTGVTGGKPIAFYDIHGRKGEMVFCGHYTRLNKPVLPQIDPDLAYNASVTSGDLPPELYGGMKSVNEINQNLSIQVKQALNMIAKRES